MCYFITGVLCKIIIVCIVLLCVGGVRLPGLVPGQDLRVRLVATRPLDSSSGPLVPAVASVSPGMLSLFTLLDGDLFLDGYHLAGLN